MFYLFRAYFNLNCYTFWNYFARICIVLQWIFYKKNLKCYFYIQTKSDLVLFGYTFSSEFILGYFCSYFLLIRSAEKSIDLCLMLFTCREFSRSVLHSTQPFFLHFWILHPTYWVPQKLPQIYTVIAYICIGKASWFEVYICSNTWNT